MAKRLGEERPHHSIAGEQQTSAHQAQRNVELRMNPDVRDILTHIDPITVKY